MVRRVFRITSPNGATIVKRSSVCGEDRRFYGPQIRHPLARHGQRRAITWAALQLPLIDVAQLRVPARREFRGLDQYPLQMLVALLRQRSSSSSTSR